MDSKLLFYDVVDIQEMLGLGRSTTYNWIHAIFKVQQPFKVVKVGKLYKIPKKSFDEWIKNLE